MLLLRTLRFTLLVPGTVAGVVLGLRRRGPGDAVARRPAAGARRARAVVLGQGVWAASPALLAYAAALAVAFRLRVVLAEEPALARTFGPAYAAYAARVPRWVGRPRRVGRVAPPRPGA